METCRSYENSLPERDFGEGSWKIGIVERLVKALSSQRIGPLARDFS
jgi:hypothetical protein